jgi:hypothetical protein
MYRRVTVAKPSFRDELAALDAEYARAELPADSLQRLRGKLAPTRRPQRWLVPALALAGAAAIAIVVWSVVRSPSDRPAEVAGFVAPPNVTLSATPDGDVTVAAGTGVVEVARADARVTVGPGVTLRRERVSAGTGVRVVAGHATFSVGARKTAAEPFVVAVSHGTITVLGTQFVVDQRATDGDVLLTEGSIRFTRDDGSETVLRPGETIAWSAPVPPAVVDASVPEDSSVDAVLLPAPAQKVREARAAKVKLELKKIDALRIRRDYHELVRRLTEVLPLVEDAATRDNLRYERCDVLVHRMNDVVRAKELGCAVP